MASLFNISDIKHGKIDKAGFGSEKYSKEVKVFLDELITFSKRQKSQYKIIADALVNTKLPEPGEIFRIRTQTQLNLFCVISKILYEHAKIDTLYIATYTLNNDIFDNLVSLVKSGKIKTLNLLIASSYKFRNEKMYIKFKDVCSATKNIHLVFAWSHFKISIALTGDNYYHWEGSMNYSVNNMAENLILSNDKELCGNDINFIKNVMEGRKTKALEVIC